MGPRRYSALTDSTQHEAIAWAHSDAPEGSRVVARLQRAGIGRGDHQWISPEGGLYFSMVERDPGSLTPLLPLSVGVQLREMLREKYGVLPSIKWPNDLLIVDQNGAARKLAGVLVDRVAARSGASRLVVGVGLNVSVPREAFPIELRDSVIGLAELTRAPVDLADLEEAVADSISKAVRSLERPDGAAVVLKGCREALYGLGRFAFIDGQPAGFVRGLAEDGGLCVESEGRIESVAAGSLTLEAMT